MWYLEGLKNPDLPKIYLRENLEIYSPMTENQCISRSDMDRSLQFTQRHAIRKSRNAKLRWPRKEYEFSTSISASPTLSKPCILLLSMEIYHALRYRDLKIYLETLDGTNVDGFSVHNIKASDHKSTILILYSKLPSSSTHIHGNTFAQRPISHPCLTFPASLWTQVCQILYSTSTIQPWSSMFCLLLLITNYAKFIFNYGMLLAFGWPFNMRSKWEPSPRMGMCTRISIRLLGKSFPISGVTIILFLLTNFSSIMSWYSRLPSWNTSPVCCRKISISLGRAWLTLPIISPVCKIKKTKKINWLCSTTTELASGSTRDGNSISLPRKFRCCCSEGQGNPALIYPGAECSKMTLPNAQVHLLNAVYFILATLRLEMARFTKNFPKTFCF